MLLVIVLAACSSVPVAGPPWPRFAARPSDGGESLAPRAAARAIAAVVEDDKPERAAADKAAPADVPSGAATTAGSTEKPPGTLPATTVSEEPITTEEIVIEIDD